LANCKVYLKPRPPKSDSNKTLWKGGYLGTTDERGFVTNTVPAAGPCEVCIVDRDSGRKRWANASIRLGVQAQPPITLDFPGPTMTTPGNLRPSQEPFRLPEASLNLK